MDVSELMVGNWVNYQFGSDPEDRYPVQLTKDMLADILTSDQDYCNRFQPIPITKEILEKNGFETHPSNLRMFLDHDDYRLCYYLNSSNRFSSFNNIDGSLVQKVIVNVHELQLAFKLLNIDKQLKL